MGKCPRNGDVLAFPLDGHLPLLCDLDRVFLWRALIEFPEIAIDTAFQDNAIVDDFDAGVVWLLGGGIARQRLRGVGQCSRNNRVRRGRSGRFGRNRYCVGRC